MKYIKLLHWLIVLCLGTISFQAEGMAAAADSSLPSAVIPEGIGVNIHFTSPRPGEMKMLADAGFRWIRMDFQWQGIEKQRGQYDFSAYDGLLSALEQYHIRAIFILDYGNHLYDDGTSPHSDDAVQAFARWAAASVKHFAGHGILWEMWNEPNGGFWHPKPDVNAYTKLALATGKAIREAEPGEAFIGPATSGIPLDFLEGCFRAGLLQYWTAVSVHPYRQNGPETAVPEYQKLRALIDRYAPAGKHIPIISGEWGYSAAWKNFTEEKQGIMFSRELLTNLSYGIPLSILYDWHDDGTDPKEGEHHFGTVAYAYHEGRDPVYDEKPAYKAVKTLAGTLKGYRFSKRIETAGKDDYLLLFSRGKHVCLVAWTTGEPHALIIAAGKGSFRVLSHLGEEQSSVQADKGQLTVQLTGAPQYFIGRKGMKIR